MNILDLPEQLQQTFEYTAKLLYNEDDGVERALLEAVELWLVEHKQQLIQAEADVNNQVFDALKVHLEQEHNGKWIIIAQGKLQGVADTPEALSSVAPNAHHRLITQIGHVQQREVELGWQMTFS